MGWPVLVFDIETIPDVAGMRAVGLGQSAEATAVSAGVDARDADALKKQLEEVGAKVEVKQN